MMRRGKTECIDIDRLLVVFVVFVGAVGRERTRRQVGRGAGGHAIDVRRDDKALESAQLLTLLIEELLEEHQSLVSVANVFAKGLKRAGGNVKRQLALRAAPLASNGLVLTNSSTKFTLTLMRVFVTKRHAQRTAARSMRTVHRQIGHNSSNVRHGHKRIQCGRFATQRTIPVRRRVGEQFFATVCAEDVLAAQSHLCIQ